MCRKTFNWLTSTLNKEISVKSVLVLVAIILIATPALNFTSKLLINILNPELNDAATNESVYQIKDIITQVRSELQKAERERRLQKKIGLFRVKDFEIEIQFVVTAKTSQSAQSGLELIVIDSKSEYAKEKVQKIKLHLVAEPSTPQKIHPTEGLFGKDVEYLRHKSVGKPKEEK